MNNWKNYPRVPQKGSSESELIMLGYDFLTDGNTESAIKIFNLNVTEFPNSANAHDSRETPSRLIPELLRIFEDLNYRRNTLL